MFDIMNTDFFSLLNKLGSGLSEFSDKIHLPDIVLLIIAAGVAVLVGCAGLYLYRILSGAGIGVIGYLAGVALFDRLVAENASLEKIPAWLGYVLGAILAILFFYFGFKKSVYAVFIVFALVGYYFTAQYVSTTFAIAIGGALLLAMISTFALKYSFILLTSFAGGFAVFSLIGDLLPRVKAIELTEGNIAAILVAVCVSLMFAIVQTGLTAKYSFFAKKQ